MRIKNTVTIQAADDTEMKNLIFSLDSTAAAAVIDSYQHVISGRLTLPLNATYSLDFDNITAVKGIYLKVDKDCVVSINGGTGITLHLADAVSTTRAKLFMEANITSVSITTPVGSAVELTYCAWGDIVA